MAPETREIVRQVYGHGYGHGHGYGYGIEAEAEAEAGYGYAYAYGTPGPALPSTPARQPLSASFAAPARLPASPAYAAPSRTARASFEPTHAATGYSSASRGPPQHSGLAAGGAPPGGLAASMGAGAGLNASLYPYTAYSDTSAYAGVGASTGVGAPYTASPYQHTPAPASASASLYPGRDSHMPPPPLTPASASVYTPIPAPNPSYLSASSPHIPASPAFLASLAHLDALHFHTRTREPETRRSNARAVVDVLPRRVWEEEEGVPLDDGRPRERVRQTSLARETPASAYGHGDGPRSTPTSSYQRPLPRRPSPRPLPDAAGRRGTPSALPTHYESPRYQSSRYESPLPPPRHASARDSREPQPHVSARENHYPQRSLEASPYAPERSPYTSGRSRGQLSRDYEQEAYQAESYHARDRYEPRYTADQHRYEDEAGVRATGAGAVPVGSRDVSALRSPYSGDITSGLHALSAEIDRKRQGITDKLRVMML
jgi:hypothetical protein